MKRILLKILLLVPLVLLLLYAFITSQNNSFIGYFGDAEMQIWQSNNLGKILFKESSTLYDSFYGTAYPYSLSLSSLLQNSSMFALFKLSGSVFFAYNISLVSFLYLNFIVMYGVLKKLGISTRIALVGGIMFFFAPSTILHAYGHPSVYIVFIFPLLFYALYQLSKELHLKWFLFTTIVVALSFYIHEYYAIMTAIMFGVFLLISSVRILKKPKYISAVFLGGIIGLLLILPFLKLYSETSTFIQETEKAPLIRSIEEMERFSARPLDYLVPPNESIFYGSLVFKPYIHSTDSENTTYLGLVNIVVLIYLLVILLHDKKLLPMFDIDGNKTIVWTCVISTLLAFILSLGPTLNIFGHLIPLPISFFQKFELFPFTSIRAWGRYGILVFTSATLLSVYAIDRSELKKYAKNIFFLIGIILIVILDQLPKTVVPTHSVLFPESLSVIKNDTEADTFVLHVPFSVHYGGLHNATAQLFQVFHGKPIVNGYASFLTSIYKDKVENTTVRCLHYPQMFEPSCVGVLSTASLTKAQIKYIIYEKETKYYIPKAYTKELDKDVRKKTQERLDELPLKKVSDNPQFVVYQVFE
ncbi:glycosyltransferase family 39 protein [Candidatus Woesebacteria bacterium]|nr:glycosyltransferase family 39 protein [Candidatus Woesebacteria bacterium]